MQKGICHLSQIPLRAQPKSSAEMVSQLLYGECYEVLCYEDEWYKIKMDFDGYEGWISQTSFCPFQAISSQVQVQLYREGRNTIKPKYPILTSIGSEISDVEESIKLMLRDIAMAFLGAPYLWGGRHFSGIDCSGFVQIVYKCLNINLPRDASQQQKMGKVVAYKDLFEGDLVFFEKNERIAHVGIALLDNKIIHAHGMVRIDELTPLGIFNSDTGLQTHSYHSAKRLR